ncbi:MAG: flavodoxin family protein [Anaerovorax sp.]|nr:flavodoxin family protein [Anaerovorax sp.]
MKILVINGSPKGKQSDTLKLTNAFLEGMGQTAKIIETMHADIRPCLGCFDCWHKTPGSCVQNDDVAEILEEFREADMVIWSAPLYCYGLPSNCKALIDRLLPLSSPAQYVDENGQTHHPSRDNHHARMMLISGCGFPDREGNFDGLIFQFRRMFGADAPLLLCVEAPLLSIPEAAPVAEPYLVLVRKAGMEFGRDGSISDETQSRLDAPMFPPDQYRTMASGS